jgi:hypothetical protein
MGGGGGSVPGAPDLSGNVSKSNAISNTATDQASQTYNTAKAYNQNAQDTLQQITGTQLPVSSQLAQTTMGNLQNYGSTFVPLQQKQAQDALSYGSDANIERMKGSAMADQASAADAARRNSADALQSEGVDPASIHGGALDAQARLEAAKGVAGAGTQSVLNTQNTARQMVNSANQLGLQVDQAGTAGVTAGANAAATTQGAVNQTNQTGVNNLTANDTLLNTGVNANKSSADIASEGFKNEMDAYNAQQAQASQGMGALGGIAGAVGGLEGGSNGLSQFAGLAASVAPLFMDDGGAIPAYGSGGVIPGDTQGAMHGTYARGGVVSGKGVLPAPPDPNHPTDTKVALVTPGEYVIPKDVALHKGHEFFHKMVDKARIDMRNRQAIPHSPAVGA